MILINSSDFDQTTNDIIDWLNFYNIEFIRLNYSDKVIVRYVEIGEGVSFQFEIFETKKILNSSDISFFWYRRGDIDINMEIECNDESQIKYFNSETDKLKEFIHYFLVNHIPSIGDFYDNDLNKLIVLTEAEKLGLLVPRTLITSYKNNLKNFKNFNGNIIRKGIFNSFELTSEVSDQVIDNSQEHFFYTLFQNNINKFIELRIFFLHKKFWATGIFSQQDEQTKNDFRNYNYAKPNRLSPFKMPNNIISKLNKLNHRMGLTSGSIDMILTLKGDYILLEINPIGQFRNFSYFSNYYLEQKIAQHMLDYEKSIAI